MGSESVTGLGKDNASAFATLHGHSLVKDIQAATVEVRSESRNCTGFFIAPGLVCTCYHAIRAPGSATSCVWNGTAFPTTATWYDESLDLALLAVDAQDHPVLSLAESPQVFGEYLAYGYQWTDRGYHGYSVLGELGGIAEDDTQQLLVLNTGVVAPGLSGAPAYSLTQGGVIGVVKRDRPEGGGYAIPIQRVAELLKTAGHALPGVRSNDLSNYRDLILKEHEYITLPDLRRKVRLEETYVTLTLGSRVALDAKSSLNLERSLGFRQDIGRKSDSLGDLGTAQRIWGQPTVRLTDLLAREAAVILGSPGTGKTTLLRHILARCCSGEILPNLDPLFIRCPDLSLGDADPLKRYLQLAFPDYWAVLHSRALEGRCVLLIDGIDEVDRETQMMIAGLSERMISRSNVVLATCRSAAFTPGLFSSRFEEFECLGFTRTQRRQYLLGWFDGALEKAKRVDSMIDSSDVATAVSSNPLLLSMLLIVLEDRMDAPLPDFRCRLYEALVDTMTTRRESQATAWTGSRVTRIRAYERIAACMLKGRMESITPTQVEEELSFDTGFCGPDLFSVSEFLDFAVRRDGLLVGNPTSRLSFAHRTIQEYCASRFFALRGEDRSSIQRYFGDPYWTETISFYAGELDSDGLRELIGARDSLDRPLSIEDLALQAKILCDAPASSEEMIEECMVGLVHAIRQSRDPTMILRFSRVVGALCARFPTIVPVFEDILGMSDGIPRTWKDVDLYISVLGSSGSIDCGRRLLSLLDRVVTDNRLLSTSRDTWHRLVLSLIDGIGESGSREARGVMLDLAMSSSSAISGAASAALEKIARGWQPPLMSLQEFIKLEWIDQMTLAAPVAASIQTEEQSQLLSMACRRAGNPELLPILRDAIDPDWFQSTTTVLEALLRNPDTSERDLACLLTFPGLEALDISAFYQTVFDQNQSDLVRISSLFATSGSDPHLARATISQLISMTPYSDLTLNLIRAFVGVLSLRRWAHCHDVLRSCFESCAATNPTESASLQTAILRLFSEVPTDDVRQMLFNQLEKGTNGSGTKYACIGLSRLRDTRVLSTIDAWLNSVAANRQSDVQLSSCAYLCLGLVGGSVASRMLIDAIRTDTSIVSIANGLDALGQLGDRESERFLGDSLDSRNWPRAWPARLPPLRSGEQRPSDRRLLSVISAMARRNMYSSLSRLNVLASDPNESDEVREGALRAVTLLSWRMAARN